MSKKSHNQELLDKYGCCWRPPGVPAKCPITGRKFMMLIEQDGEWHATYGGPYDSYKIPSLAKGTKDELPQLLDGERYDHDKGCWTDEEDQMAYVLTDGQLGDEIEKMTKPLEDQIESLKAKRKPAVAK